MRVLAARGAAARWAQRHFAGNTRACLAASLLACSGAFALDLQHAQHSEQHLLDLVFLPFLLSLFWLGPKGMVLVGIAALALKPAAIVWAKEPALLVTNDWPFDLAVETIAVVLCILAAQWRYLLQKSQQELELALTKSLKAAALIHEIKQPISLLLHQSRNLLLQHEQQDLDAAKLQQGINTLAQASQALANATEVATTLLRVGTTNRASCIDWAALLRQSAAQQAQACTDAQIELHCHIEPQEIWIKADASQLNLLINNLISNGIEALAAVADQKRTLMIHLRVLESRGQAELKVADSAMGFKNKTLEAVRLRSSKANGLGMGLFIANQIAIDHGGTLALGRSAQCGGAEVCVRLPLSSHSSH
jgi:signal transduction histidine kinase